MKIRDIPFQEWLLHYSFLLAIQVTQEPHLLEDKQKDILRLEHRIFLRKYIKEKKK